METTNLNPLFIDQIANFSHLVTTTTQTKEQFLNTLKTVYSLENPKNQLFYLATKKSKFNTIRLSDNRQQLLLNH